MLDETNGGGSSTPESSPETITNWYDTLPDHVKAWQEVKTSQNADAFFNQVENMRSMIGRSVQVPGPDASPEARQKYLEKILEKTPEVILKPSEDNIDQFYDSIGRPKSPTEYKLPENAMEANEAQLNSFKEAAHQAGLNQKQFEAVFGKMSEASKAQQEQMMAQMQEQMQGLRGEWGLAFDQNLTMVEKVKQDFFPHLDVPARDLDPATLRALYTIGKRMGGEGAQMTKEPGSSGAMTPNDAEAAIGEIMSNRQHAYWNPSHPGHKAAVQRVIKLHEYKNGAV